MAEIINNLETYSIQNVEVFAAGTWNKDKYTISNLHGMVAVFNKYKDKLKPYLKLGHNNEQQLAQADGLPALGWITSLKVKGSKLIADFSDVPEKVYKLIKAKAYRKVSSEIYWDINIAGQKHKHMLAGVALLGTELPAVTTLSDILGMYAGQFERLVAYKKNVINIKNYQVSKETLDMPDNMTDETNKDLELAQGKIATLESSLKEYSKKADEASSQVAALNEQIKSFQSEMDEKNKKLYTAEKEKFLSDLVSENHLIKSAHTIVEQLYDGVSQSSKKEYSLGDKKVEAKDALKELLKVYSALSPVSFSEKSTNEHLEGEEQRLGLYKKLIAEGKSEREAYKLANS